MAHADDTNVLLPILYDQHLLKISNNSKSVLVVQSAINGGVTTPRPTKLLIRHLGF